LDHVRASFEMLALQIYDQAKTNRKLTQDEDRSEKTPPDEAPLVHQLYQR
jgi:hypothetical protein